MKVIGLLILGGLCLWVNFTYGALVLTCLPGIISGQDVYISRASANGVEALIMVFEILLFSGAINRKDGTNLWEAAAYVAGVVTAVLDVWSNTVPWIVGNSTSSQLLSDYWYNMYQAITHPSRWVALMLILGFGVLAGLGGEFFLGTAWKELSKGWQGRHSYTED